MSALQSGVVGVTTRDMMFICHRCRTDAYVDVVTVPYDYAFKVANRTHVSCNRCRSYWSYT